MNYLLSATPAGEYGDLVCLDQEFERGTDEQAMRHSEILAQSFMGLVMPDGRMCTKVDMTLKSWGEYDILPSLVKEWSIPHEGDWFWPSPKVVETLKICRFQEKNGADDWWKKLKELAMKLRIYQIAIITILVTGIALVFASTHLLAPPADLRAPRDPITTSEYLVLFGGVGCIVVGALAVILRK